MSAPLPARLGSYRILALVAEGGMGAVYEAVQDSPQRTVALKVIRPDLSSPELLRRFEHEAQVLGRLQHPYIAQIYEAGMAEGERGLQPYFAMEMVRGVPLTEYATREQLGTGERLQLMRRVAEGVEHAHQKGVIHRDLKPGNVLVQADGTPKIVDFGVARLTDSDLKATLRTDVGQLLGTLAYMSPEQVAADPMELDTRSDVYALGVMLYELLTGELPYDTGGRMIHEVARIIREVDPRPLSSINQRLGGDLDTVVAKALEKEKARRYSSAAAFGADIEHFLRDEPIVARKASLGYQLKKFARRHRVAVVAALSVLLTLVAGAVVATLEAVRANRAEALATERAESARSARLEAEAGRAEAERARLAEAGAREQAEAAARRAQDEAQKVAAQSAFLEQMFSSVEPQNAGGREVTVREILDDAARALEQGALAGAPVVEAGVRGTLGRTYQALGDYREAQVHLERVVELLGPPGRAAATSAGGADPDAELARVRGWFDLAKLYLSMDRFDEADRLFGDVSAEFERLLGPDSLEEAELLHQVAYLRYNQGEFEQSLELTRRYLERVRREPEGLRLAQALDSLAFILEEARRYDETETIVRESLAVYERTGNGEHPQRLRALLRLGNALVGQGRDDEGRDLLEQSLALAARIYPRDHPRMADVHQQLASLSRGEGRYEDALRHAQLALEIRGARLGPSRDTATSLAETGVLLRRLGRLAEAESATREALAMRRQVFGDEGAAIGDSLLNLGQVRRDQGALEEAEELLAAAVANWRTHLPKGQVDLAGPLREHAWVLRALRRYDEAERDLREALTLRDAHLAPTDERVMTLCEELIQLLLDAERWEAAESMVRETLQRMSPAIPPLARANLDISLGASLAGRGEFERAEVLMLAGWRILEPDPRLWIETKVQAAERIRRFYEAAADVEAQEHWRGVRDALESSRGSATLQR